MWAKLHEIEERIIREQCRREEESRSPERQAYEDQSDDVYPSESLDCRACGDCMFGVLVAMLICGVLWAVVAALVWRWLW